MYEYDLETQMWDRQRDMLRDAGERRLAVIAHSRPDGQGGHGPRLGFLAAMASGLRSLLTPGRTARIEHPGLGDAS